MFRTYDDTTVIQKSKTKLFNLSIAAALLVYSVLSALTPFVSQEASASGGGYDPYATTVYDEQAAEGSESSSGASSSGTGGAGGDVRGDSTDDGSSGGGESGSGDSAEGGAAGATDPANDNKNKSGQSSGEEANGEAAANQCSELLGVCWYWWVPVAAIVVGVALYYLRQPEEA